MEFLSTNKVFTFIEVSITNYFHESIASDADNNRFQDVIPDGIPIPILLDKERIGKDLVTQYFNITASQGQITLDFLEEMMSMFITFVLDPTFELKPLRDDLYDLFSPIGMQFTNFPLNIQSELNHIINVLYETQQFIFGESIAPDNIPTPSNESTSNQTVNVIPYS